MSQDPYIAFIFYYSGLFVQLRDHAHTYTYLIYLTFTYTYAHRYAYLQIQRSTFICAYVYLYVYPHITFVPFCSLDLIYQIIKIIKDMETLYLCICPQLFPKSVFPNLPNGNLIRYSAITKIRHTQDYFNNISSSVILSFI